MTAASSDPAMRPGQLLFRIIHALVLALSFSSLAACAHALSEEPPIDKLIDKMSSMAVFKLSPGQTPAYFEELCGLTSKGPGKHLWVQENSAPGRGMAWVRIEFQPGEKVPWTLLQGTVALPLGTAAHQDLYATLRTRLIKKLGKPELVEEQQEEKMLVWSLGADRKLILRRGPIDNPYLKRTQTLVALEAAVAQGR